MLSAKLWVTENWSSESGHYVMDPASTGVRALNALKDFYKLNLQKEEDIHKLGSLYNKEHKNLLNDYIYIVYRTRISALCKYFLDNFDENHCYDIDIITRFLENMDYSNQAEELQDDIIQFEFIRDLLDSLHCYVMMSYHFGYKSNQKESHEASAANNQQWNETLQKIKQNQTKIFHEIFTEMKYLLVFLHKN